MGTIIYLIGLVLAIIACVEIVKVEGKLLNKVLAIVLLLITSWLGLLFYYLYARKRIAGWLK